MAWTRLGIIGCGNMGEAILKGVIASGGSRRRAVLITEIDPKKRQALSKKYGISLADDNAALAERSDVILLAVKPYEIGHVLKEVSKAKHLSSKLVISIAAGIPIKRIEHTLGGRPPVIRAMPNMPAIIGRGVTVICPGRYAGKLHMTKARELLSVIGDVVEADEAHMDIVTALSGSGPAYFFYLIECLIEAAAELGMSEEKAKALAVKTALGSAEVLEKTKRCPKELRGRVTSKGGTTEAAFKVFEAKAFKEIIKEALRAARDRARELSRG